MGIQAATQAAFDRIPGYRAYVEDVDVSLWRGAYILKGIRIYREGDTVKQPLFAADAADFSVYWTAFLSSGLVGELHLQRPRLHFVDTRDNIPAENGSGVPWGSVISKLFPLSLAHVEVRDGAVELRSERTFPSLAFLISDVEGEAVNLTNAEGERDDHFARLRFGGKLPSGGTVTLQSALAPESSTPDFRLSFQLKGLDLSKANLWLATYSLMSVTRGIYGLEAQLSVRGGNIQGTLRPQFQELEVAYLSPAVGVGRAATPTADFLGAIAGDSVRHSGTGAADPWATEIRIQGAMAGLTGWFEAYGTALRAAGLRTLAPWRGDPLPQKTLSRAPKSDPGRIQEPGDRG